MDLYSQMVVNIIAGQENIIGPVAVEQAKRVKGLELDWDKREAKISGNPKQVVDELVEQYKVLFGQISVEVSKEAVSHLVAKLPAEELPENFK